eukprot:8361098-Alexandrium_andersonii.AAC.1
MSASLVGSEMCIRDSRDWSAMFGSRRGQLRIAFGNSIRTTTAFRRTRAVSYTHLTLPTICSV